MDDVPAGPASPGPRRPSLSVVVPVRNGGRDFERCLRRLRDSDLADFELIVVDDGSTDASAAVAERAGAIVVRFDRPQGPAAARNRGAREASAPLIFFLDADVAVHPPTLGRALARFAADPGLSALFGSYDDHPQAPGIVSQYRNLLHHFVHQQGDFRDDIRPAHTFWTGCGLMRREVFLAFGGFDPRLYPRPAIEDIELGYRLTSAGHRIVLARDVQATHMKRWSLAEMVRTDIFRRGVPWMLLIKRTGIAETDLNVKATQKVCVALTGLTLVCAAAGLSAPWWTPGVFAAAASLAGLTTIVALNRRYFAFLAQRKGWGFAGAAVLLHLVYYVCCGLSVIIAAALWQIGQLRETPVRPDRAAVPPPHLAIDRREEPKGLAQRLRTRFTRRLMRNGPPRAEK
jgi:GT2 family glycosyltransferase